MIFFARYEASQLGSNSIETEHLLLGLIREGKGLTSRIFSKSHLSMESIRKDIEGRALYRDKVSTSVDIPLSSESKRVLGYASEEAERMLGRVDMQGGDRARGHRAESESRVARETATRGECGAPCGHGSNQEHPLRIAGA